MVVSNGHRLAISLAARNFSLSRNLSEIWSGITQLSAIKRMTDALDEKRLQSLSEELSGIRDALFVRQRVKMALIGDSAALPGAETGAGTLFESFNQARDTEGASAPQAFGPTIWTNHGGISPVGRSAA
jgi:Zn-dependent M16 (insulinase) family peptidase